MKKLFALLLALSLVFALSAGLTASAEEPFDPDLVGAWVLDKAEDNDNVSSDVLDNLFDDLFFLHDGSFSSDVLPFEYVSAMVLDAPKAMTDKGTIVLYDALSEAMGEAEPDDGERKPFWKKKGRNR